MITCCTCVARGIITIFVDDSLLVLHINLQQVRLEEISFLEFLYFKAAHQFLK